MYLVDGRGSIALENAKVHGELALITLNQYSFKLRWTLSEHLLLPPH
jgi:hypothetical protein